MSTDFDCVIVMPGNADTGGMPYIAEPENIDLWPSAQATRRAHETLIELFSRGYEGVKLQVAKLSDGHTLIDYQLDAETAAGRFAQIVMMLAKSGRAQPPDEAIAVLNRIYRERGLAIPQTQNPGVGAPGSN